jgi:uncharacterized protein YprB with RNaseH-like and TPR domain
MNGFSRAPPKQRAEFYLDLETSGLCHSDEVVTWAWGASPDKITCSCQIRGKTGPSLGEDVLLESLARAVGASRKPGQELVIYMYNGEHYRGGFDLPLLRVRYARSRPELWPFRDSRIVDLYEICQKRVNTLHYEEKTLDSLKLEQLQSLARLLNDGIAAKTKDANLDIIAAAKDLTEKSRKAYSEFMDALEAPVKSKCGLHEVYTLLGGPALPENGWDGAEVPGLFREYCRSFDSKTMAKIAAHNAADLKRMMFIRSRIGAMLPARDLEGIKL